MTRNKENTMPLATILGAAIWSLMIPGSVQAYETDPWVNCIYNKANIACRRTFLCANAQCDQFGIEWKDGLKDRFKKTKAGITQNVTFYRDSRGGEWILREHAGAFALINQKNGNKIIYNMTIEECKKSMMSDLCRQ